MATDNKIGSLTRTWPKLPVNKDSHDKKNQKNKFKEKKEDSNDKEHKDPGDTIIDEYV